MLSSNTLRLALIQLKVGMTKSQNLSRARALVKEAVENRANIVCLPECCNSPYGVEYFGEYSEKENGESARIFSDLAKEFSVHLIAGSIPEEDNGKLYNTCFVYDSNGMRIAKYRKVHLFDIDIPGGVKFTESDVLYPGDKPQVFTLGKWKIGIGICYDVRFPELSKCYENAGCNLLVYPAAFTVTTGAKHWELLARARANDHQLFTALCSPSRNDSAKNKAYGHSLICNPWGKVIGEAGIEEEIVYADLDLKEVDEVRAGIPTRHQKRHDVYQSAI